MKKPVVLVIRDGWGIRKNSYMNAISKAKTPNFNNLKQKYPKIELSASGKSVGIPEGFMGNSEVGHMTIGAGRIKKEAILRIDEDIQTNNISKNKAFNKIIDALIKKDKTLHLLGLLSDKGVHSHISHLIALIKLAHKKGLKKIIVHPITDGRDSPPKSALEFIQKIDKIFKELKIGKFGVIVGRYYAMDRDKRWIRTELAYHALTSGRGEVVQNYKEAITLSYENDESDEFIRPKIIQDYKGFVKDDGVIFFNYRFDRTRQLTKALIEKRFREFHVTHKKIKMVTMTQYYDNINCDVAYPPVKIKNLLGEVLSKNKIKQLRISETEKYAHVTFFFNGLIEEPNKYEDRILVPSPRIATYDLKPEMSVYEVTEKLLTEMEKDYYDFIVVNLVNCDMVGHTGDIKATKKAVECVDDCCGKIVQKILKKDGIGLITADHGNCEEMCGDYKTSHTTNPVHLILVSNDKKLKFNKKEGGLSNIAPTILNLFEIKIPKEMDSESLI
jgi:2,3-bisphosphoglycerate-independent phosphoglycerate mutase